MWGAWSLERFKAPSPHIEWGAELRIQTPEADLCAPRLVEPTARWGLPSRDLFLSCGDPGKLVVPLFKAGKIGLAVFSSRIKSQT